MDVVYALGTASKMDNTELRYSLRSLEKHGHNVDSVYIVGDWPAWLKSDLIKWIPAIDPHECCQRNIMEKISAACRAWAISDEFLFMNDDHFMLEDFDAGAYQFFYKNLIADQINERANKANDHYGRALLRTLNDLMAKGKPALNFDVHTPIRYKKKDFLDIMKWYNWEDRFGYVIKSLYANSQEFKGSFREDCKINAPKTEAQIYERIKGLDCFSIGDKALCPGLINVLNELYPNKSKYEI